MLIAMDSALRIGFDFSRPSTIYWMLPVSIPHKAIIDSIASPPLTRYQVSMNFFSSNGATYSRWRGGGGVVGKFPGCHCEGQVEFGSMPTRKFLRRRVFTRSSPEHSESQSGSRIGSWIQKYLPSEDIREPLPADDKELDRLTVAETARTLIEVNSKAALMFSEDMGDVQQNVIWPDVPYLTDENGDIYFKASNDDRILRNFISDEADETLVHVIIGVDNVELLAEMEAAGSSVFNFGAEEAEYEDVGLDYDSEEDDLVIYDEEEDEDDDDAMSEMSNDWSSAETMQSTHPVYFARKIAEVVSNANLDWMDQPSASIVIQGLLRPAFVEEHKLSKKLPFIGDTGINDRGKHIKGNVEGEMDTDQSLPSGTTFYKLEILNIQLVSACGNQCTVKIQDFHLARPDIIAHSAANILSRLKAGGEKTTQALKALCWRLRGIKVEEASIIGLDSAGFDLRVCSGTQIQTLRFAFVTRATSEFSAEKQTHDLLFPRF